MQTNDQLQAPFILSTGKLPSLPIGQEATDIVEGVLIGTFDHPQVSHWSHIWVGRG
jgi:hypothetical protein